MSEFISNFLRTFNTNVYWSSIIKIVPILLIVFGVAFGLNKIREWLFYFSCKNDPDCLGYEDEDGKYHHFRNTDY